MDTLVRGKVVIDRVCWGCDLMIQDRTFTFDFTILDMMGFNEILSMDWLSSVRATIDDELPFAHRWVIVLSSLTISTML